MEFLVSGTLAPPPSLMRRCARRKANKETSGVDPGGARVSMVMAMFTEMQVKSNLTRQWPVPDPWFGPYQLAGH